MMTPKLANSPTYFSGLQERSFWVTKQGFELTYNVFIDATRLPVAAPEAITSAMFNIISLVIGGLTLMGALVAFIPLLGWINWFLIPIALVGLVLGVLSKSTAGRNLNLVVLVVCG